MGCTARAEIGQHMCCAACNSHSHSTARVLRAESVLRIPPRLCAHSVYRRVRTRRKVAPRWAHSRYRCVKMTPEGRRRRRLSMMANRSGRHASRRRRALGSLDSWQGGRLGLARRKAGRVAPEHIWLPRVGDPSGILPFLEGERRDGSGRRRIEDEIASPRLVHP